jgi:hypothetical protein
MSNIVKLRRPMTFDSREAFIEQVSIEILKSQLTFESIAHEARARNPALRLCAATVGKLARRDTRWPRHTTLFAILDIVGCEIALTRKRK